MRVALTSDFHLDMRQFNSQQRWNDFLETFIKVTQEIKERKIDVYIIAGDLFHKHRPHPGVVRRFLKEISSVDCTVLFIRGNHDSPQILFDKYGGDTLHLIRDVSDIVYLNRKTPSLELDNVCFVGVGYHGFNVSQVIQETLKQVKTRAEIKIGIFHQLLDFPGIPEINADISRSLLKGFGFDYNLLGHYHIAYSENQLLNAGSPEYWAFDQATQINFNLDHQEEKIKPAFPKGFFILETNNGKTEFVNITPARPMFNITYETDNFIARSHMPIIKDHLKKYDLEGAMVKTTIKGNNRTGRVNLSRELHLKNPLIHNTAIMLRPSDIVTDKINVVQAQTQYLVDHGINKLQAKKIAKWIETDKERLAQMQTKEFLKALRDINQK